MIIILAFNELKMIWIFIWLALLASICVFESNLIFSIPMFGAAFHRPIVTLR